MIVTSVDDGYDSIWKQKPWHLVHQTGTSSGLFCRLNDTMFRLRERSCTFLVSARAFRWWPWC